MVTRDLLNDLTLIRTRSHEQRELSAAEWQDIRWQDDRRLDVRAWTLELIPLATMGCRDRSLSWTILVANDLRSAEVRNDGKPMRYGILQCAWTPGKPQKSINVFAVCGSHIADSGFGATFTRVDAKVSASLSSESIAGPSELARLDFAPRKPE